MDFLKVWPGTQLVLLYGNQSFSSLRDLETMFTMPREDPRYGIFIMKKKQRKNDRCDLVQLYGGNPVLVINAIHFTYSEISKLGTGLFGETRRVHVTPDFPYWHHSFTIEQKPYGFTIEKDQSALDSLCSQCLCQFMCVLTKKACHTICDACARANFELPCFHASHKREYIDQEDANLFDGVGDEFNIGFCPQAGCDDLIDPHIVCMNCQASGFCSELCLRLNHEC